MEFTVHILLKPGLENFEHYFTSMWDECNCVVLWAFFGIAFLWDWTENWPFPVLWPLLSFPNLLAYWKVAQRLKHLPGMQETWDRSLGWEDPLEKEMATHSSSFAWRIPWMEEPGRLQSTGSQRVGHDWATWLYFTFTLLIEYSTFTASSFRIWKSSTGISSPPLSLFAVMLPNAHLTSQSKMSGSWWVITPSWLSWSWRSFFLQFFCVFLPHLLNIFCFC